MKREGLLLRLVLGCSIGWAMGAGFAVLAAEEDSLTTMMLSPAGMTTETMTFPSGSLKDLFLKGDFPTTSALTPDLLTLPPPRPLDQIEPEEEKPKTYHRIQGRESMADASGSQKQARSGAPRLQDNMQLITLRNGRKLKAVVENKRGYMLTLRLENGTRLILDEKKIRRIEFNPLR